jgi:hypothetical protein
MIAVVRIYCPVCNARIYASSCVLSAATSLYSNRCERRGIFLIVRIKNTDDAAIAEAICSDRPGAKADGRW